MAWWTWALILWAMTASVAVLWLVARLSAKVELLAEDAADRDDLWEHDLPENQPLAEPRTPRKSVEVLAHWAAEVRRHFASRVHR